MNTKNGDTRNLRESPFLRESVKMKEKAAGLDLGANDYVTKPFEIDELLARIRSALRFSKPAVPAQTKDEHLLEYAVYSMKLKLKTANMITISISTQFQVKC